MSHFIRVDFFCTLILLLIVTRQVWHRWTHAATDHSVVKRQLVSGTRNDCKNLQWSRWIKCNSAFTTIHRGLVLSSFSLSFFFFDMVKTSRSRVTFCAQQCFSTTVLRDVSGAWDGVRCARKYYPFSLGPKTKLLNSDGALKGCKSDFLPEYQRCVHLNRPRFHTEWVQTDWETILSFKSAIL